jgi:hypothetical protein
MRAFIKPVIRIIIMIIGIQLLFALFKDISSFFYDTGIFTEEKVFFYLGIILGVDIVGLAVLFILWWKADWLSNILAGNMDEGALIIKTSNIDFLTAAIQIIGIFLVVTSIPNFIGIAVYHIQIQTQFQGFDLSVYQAQETKQWAITAVTFLIGLLLTLGSRWLVRRMQSTGNLEQPDNKKDS